MLNRIKTTLIIFILLIHTEVDAQYQFLLHKSYAERYQALDTLFYRPAFWKLDSTLAFAAINKLERLAQDKADRELALETRLLKISYTRNQHDQYNRPHYEALLKSLLETANKEDVLQMQIRVHYLLSAEYLITDSYGKAFEHQIQYYNLLKKVTPKEFPWKKLCIAHIGGLYYSFEDYETAKKYMLEANHLPGSYKIGDDIDVLNTLGLIMRNTGKYDSALYYFNKALAVALNHNETLWLPVINGNIGIIYYHQEKYDKAKPLLKMNMDRGLAAKDYENTVNSIIKLADIYRMQDRYDSAWHLSKAARHTMVYVWHPYQHLVPLYRLMRTLAAQTGNRDLALTYADSVTMAMDSLSNRKNVLLLARAQRKIGEETHNAEIALMNSEKNAQLFIRNSLIVFVFLAAIIGWLLLTRQRQKHKQERELAAAELSRAAKQLNDFTRRIQEKKQLIESFSAEIERLQALPCSNELPDSRENLLRLQRSTILTDEQWNDFREIFETVHSGYMQRLKEKLPDLSPAETRFMVLSKLKLSPKEMAGMLGVGVTAIRQYRFRLRKKLDLPETGDIEELVDMI